MKVREEITKMEVVKHSQRFIADLKNENINHIFKEDNYFFIKNLVEKILEIEKAVKRKQRRWVCISNCFNGNKADLKI